MHQQTKYLTAEARGLRKIDKPSGSQDRIRQNLVLGIADYCEAGFFLTTEEAAKV